ncbi:MAG: histidine phosphatase family protein [Henriciella sp.]|uniref:histidine phosphatase family protein n=1 Tax=Henriciella sp. TaxID=1968823 RepID=UPI003C777D1D
MIWLVRHGEAAAGWGEADDPGLSALGHKQADAAADILSSQSIVKIICSPMTRCQETARPFSTRAELDVRTEARVSEIPTPEGLSDRRAWLSGFMAGDWSEAPALLVDWKSDLIQTLDGLEDNTVVFTHFIAINTIVGHLTGSAKVTNFRPGHCSITKLKTSPEGLSVAELGSESATRVL